MTRPCVRAWARERVEGGGKVKDVHEGKWDLALNIGDSRWNSPLKHILWRDIWFFPYDLIAARLFLADDESVDVAGAPPRGCPVRATHTRTAATLTCTRGSTASSTRSESSALSFCTRPLIIKSRGWILFTAFPCHLCVSSARHQVAMLAVKTYHRGEQGRLHTGVLERGSMRLPPRGRASKDLEMSSEVAR